jgi:fermentation-respiration switch protein FrsA (DUF1100 family)
MGLILTILMYIGIVIVSIIGAYVVFMLIMALGPRKPVLEQPLEKAKKPPQEKDTLLLTGSKMDVSFDVKGTPVKAWLYLPEDLSAPVPCIIMAHGLGGTKTLGLEHYALRFQKAEFAVLVFDYRNLGESGGKPRQLVWIPYQQEDYAAAVQYVRNLEEIDPARIALWGTSLSGGHVIVTAARDSKIACVSAQVPLLDGDAGGMQVVKQIGLWHLLKMAFGHGLRDLVRSWLGLSPHVIPLLGKPGSIAALADAGAWNFFNQIAPDDFINKVSARILIRMDKYHPIKHTSKINCPVLLQVCDKDISLPLRVVEKAEKNLREFAELIRYPVDHFDIYIGENFEKAVRDQLDFFKKHLVH